MGSMVPTRSSVLSKGGDLADTRALGVGHDVRLCEVEPIGLVGLDGTHQERRVGLGEFIRSGDSPARRLGQSRRWTRGRGTGSGVTGIGFYDAYQPSPTQSEAPYMDHEGAQGQLTHCCGEAQTGLPWLSP